MKFRRAITDGVLLVAFLSGCGDLQKDSYTDTTPTSGRLLVCFDEGLAPHVKNQAYTFESQYRHATLRLSERTEDACVEALLGDSCEAIVISRPLNENERARFSARRINPRHSHVATSGLAFVTSTATPLVKLEEAAMAALLKDGSVRDTSGNPIQLRVLIDRNNSSVMRYLADSVLRGGTFGDHSSSVGSTPATLDYVAAHPNSIGIIDFAWLSDRDDSLFRSHAPGLRFLGIQKTDGVVSFPSQSSFRTGEYPYARKIYVMRKTGDFTLAKGFESFVAGPKGQLTFLKQGLLPARQAERNIEINMEPLAPE